ncbi:glycosyl transferase [Aphanothece hegewaldii CCALA 016]|uniref:Glycosyl transferase n=1 Tax=Aphanothece hegewaldii CCALA 016 TaxID=2107694 RepID=A0A2T1LTJ6_9CHRO|nr:glycosyltransferase family 2 protein [Aphanothece hegewaldii]PSF34244.1 glycosyl transferase [Aphanothece hegewaldii CCALA 016]
MEQKTPKIGIVVIGRNEGERLRRCLLSVLDQATNIIYVDSGSTDGSVEMAKSLSACVVELDLSIPFTAARARNAGFEHLLQINPNVEYVQFVDGDCEMISGWLEAAQQELNNRPLAAIVCGRLRERFPEYSLYNRLCDMEWNTPVGEMKTCGGIVMMRVAALQQVGGFNPELIAGEEPELCVRLRYSGWTIWRIKEEMAYHDAQMLHFRQWWKRSIRSGHAYAQGAWLHGKPPEYHWVRENLSIGFWGLFFPLFVVILACFTQGWGLILFGVYFLLIYRIYRRKRQESVNNQDAFFYALFCVLSKFPQVYGQFQFYLSRLGAKKSTLIEYRV